MASPDRKQFEAELSAYIDDELSAERRAEVEAALAADPVLRFRLSQLRKVAGGLQLMPRTKTPIDLSPALQRAAERQTLFGGARAGQPRIVRLLIRFTAAAAVVFMCGFAAYEILRRPSYPEPDLVVVPAEPQMPPTDDAEAPVPAMADRRSVPPGVPERKEEAVARSPVIARGGGARRGVGGSESVRRPARGVTADASAAPAEMGVVADTGSESAAATVRLLVRPRTAAELGAVLQTVERYERNKALPMLAPAPRARRQLVGKAEPGESVMLALAPENVGALMQALSSKTRSVVDVVLRVDGTQLGQMAAIADGAQQWQQWASARAADEAVRDDVVPAGPPEAPGADEVGDGLKDDVYSMTLRDERGGGRGPSSAVQRDERPAMGEQVVEILQQLEGRSREPRQGLSRSAGIAPASRGALESGGAPGSRALEAEGVSDGGRGSLGSQIRTTLIDWGAWLRGLVGEPVARALESTLDQRRPVRVEIRIEPELDEAGARPAASRSATD